MQKYLKISGILFILLYSLSVKAQTEINSKYINTTTYKLLQEESWKELIKVAKVAFKNDIDYYYLRMRAGIAYYEMGKYLKAVPHFQKALEFNSLDQAPYEYIYYALLFSGRIKEAQVFSKLHQKYLPDKTRGDTASLRNISLDFAYHFNNEKNISDNFDNFNTTDSLEGYQIIPRTFFNADYLFTHDLSRRVSLSHGASILRKKSYYYSSSSGINYESDQHSINQIQYYAGLRIHTGVNSWLYTSFHFLNYNSRRITFQPRGSGYIFKYPDQNYKYYSARLAFYKNLSLFKAGAGLNYSKLSFENQVQADLFLSYKPFGNLNLYFTNNAYAVIDDTNPGIDNAMLSFSNKAGVKIFDHLWLEAGAFYGEIKTLATNDGFVIYNGEETINQRFDVNFIFPFKKVKFYLNGSYLNYTSQFNEEQSNIFYNTLKFNGITIIGGISWNI